MCAPVKRFGVTSAGLLCASLLTLAACGSGDDTATTAGSAPSAAATTAAPASAAPSAPVAADGASKGDKEICESVKKAGEDMKAGLITALSSGEEPSPAVFKKILTDMNNEVSSLAESGGDSKVVAALKEFGAQAAKAAKAADPAEAASNPDFEKSGAALTAACKTTGVDVNF